MGTHLPPVPRNGINSPLSVQVYCGQTVAHLSYCWALVCVWNICGTDERICGKIHMEDVFGPSLGRVWRSKVKVTRDKNWNFWPFRRPACSLFGRTCLACSFGLQCFYSYRILSQCQCAITALLCHSYCQSTRVVVSVLRRSPDIPTSCLEQIVECPDLGLRRRCLSLGKKCLGLQLRGFVENWDVGLYVNNHAFMTYTQSHWLTRIVSLNALNCFRYRMPLFTFECAQKTQTAWRHRTAAIWAYSTTC